MGVEPFLVSSSLTGIIGQRLLRRVCPTCSRPYIPDVDELAPFARRPDRTADFRHGTGCTDCSHTGFLERIGVYEVLRITPGVRSLLMDRADASAIHRLAMSEGMAPMEVAAMDLAQRGITTIGEVVRMLGETAIGERVGTQA